MNREGGWGEDLAASPGTAADRARPRTTAVLTEQHCRSSSDARACETRARAESCRPGNLTLVSSYRVRVRDCGERCVVQGWVAPSCPTTLCVWGEIYLTLPYTRPPVGVGPQPGYTRRQVSSGAGGRLGLSRGGGVYGSGAQVWTGFLRYLGLGVSLAISRHIHMHPCDASSMMTSSRQS